MDDWTWTANPAQLVLGIALLVLSALLLVAVMMQSSKDKRSGVISGVAETYFSKGKTGRMDKALNTATVAMSALYVVLIVALYCLA
jgi:protein translocase SecG subunit